MLMSRRFFLQSTGALAMYMGVTPLLAVPGGAALPQMQVRRNKTLVVIFLRGGADGLNMVVPFGDEHYYKLRRQIAIASPGSDDPLKAIDLDGFFGLHPRMASCKPLFDRGVAVAAHAVGYSRNTRSHFEEQDTWETGIVGNTVNSDGWLNRHLATSTGNGQVRAVSIGDSLPRILHGKAQAFAVRGLDDLVLPTGRLPAEKVAAALEHAYCTDRPDKAAADAADLLAQTAGTTLEGLEELRVLTKQEYKPAAEYPRGSLGTKLMQVARLIKADVGLEVAEVDLGGWDTHQNQGTGGRGTFADLVGQLSDSLAAFNKDLGDRMDDVVVVTLTDFGRTAAENGTAGTDHGWANAMLVMGGAVQRANKAAAAEGKPRLVAGRWPGLAPDQLNQRRDLLHTTDFRDVLGELVRVHLGNQNIQTVLPSHTFKPVGLVTA
ncbi:MAG: DUF1501 domain-containing protein [Planctomycetaceae bacterium]|jgi:uncharacterized protein (DUF1501 family)|nr:DUF1501 domain-containing protein [Phycisphaerales bacterium]MCE2652232.1 DUF1501 domain-containing protein [Planctomycetaceae bacterium]